LRQALNAKQRAWLQERKRKPDWMKRVIPGGDKYADIKVRSSSASSSSTSTSSSSTSSNAETSSP
jgi:hypothetical protein